MQQEELPFILKTKLPIEEDAVNLFEESYNLAEDCRNEFITPEHFMMRLFKNDLFGRALERHEVDLEEAVKKLRAILAKQEQVPAEFMVAPTPSAQFLEMVALAEIKAKSSGKDTIETPHLVSAMFRLEDSYGTYLLLNLIHGNESGFMADFLEEVENEGMISGMLDIGEASPQASQKGDWRQWVTCVNEVFENFNPLIGREEELQKTIRVLCRKEKNNPLHIGEPGVGKTALVNGLARLIEEGRVPEKLKGAKIYRLDMGTLIAGTQYRGDFEKRIKSIMDGVSREENPIVYIDEIHTLVGAGSVNDGSMDASNMLKPYLESGKIRFIGSTTYDEYKRYFAKSKSIVRRFSNIDISEPTIEETIHILQQLQPMYEEFHKVRYTPEAIEFAASGSAKYINDRFLPDKAIDLLDESGATKQLETGEDGEKTVDVNLMSAVLAKICKVDSLAVKEEKEEELGNLEEKISEKIFGQEGAVKEVAESVLMSKAGLTEENKPMASLLFVGPTGVGETEVAKVLAKELGIELIRFDMSEYTEKHAVAKLIGSPAGYVGYEDGGMLTDAIRKTPNAVLLLDEIEKAHQDIYNILLQVMDYAKLSDNKGNKADFRNVVLIMTSNAGAQYASQANMGFASNVTKGDAMMKSVKKTFKPEFLNRLSATVVFNDMSRKMAAQILDKKLKELQSALTSKNVTLKIYDEAKEYLLEKGFTPEYGARELERVIHHELKRILMKDILFGHLKEGGIAEIDVSEQGLRIRK